LGWKGHLKLIQSKPSAISGAIFNLTRSLRAPSSLALRVSRDGASPTSHHPQCKNFFLTSSLNHLSSSLKPSPLVLLQQTLLKSLSPSPPSPRAHAAGDAAPGAVGFWAASTHLWVMASFPSPSTPHPSWHLGSERLAQPCWQRHGTKPSFTARTPQPPAPLHPHPADAELPALGEAPAGSRTLRAMPDPFPGRGRAERRGARSKAQRGSTVLVSQARGRSERQRHLVSNVCSTEQASPVLGQHCPWQLLAHLPGTPGWVGSGGCHRRSHPHPAASGGGRDLGQRCHSPRRSPQPANPG